MKKMKCYFRLHKWKKSVLTKEMPTVANNGLWKYLIVDVCKECNALKGPRKEGSSYVYTRRNEVK